MVSCHFTDGGFSGVHFNRPGMRINRNGQTREMSKHVDFVICAQDMYVLGIIELDDRTHLRQDRMERDAFVDTVLRSAGYQVKHTWDITPDILDSFLDLKLQTFPGEKIISPTGWIWNEDTKLWDPPKR